MDNRENEIMKEAVRKTPETAEPGMTESGDVILTMRGISKSFPGTKALNRVDFTLRKGEIHALMGENGAGKSTRIKVLTGVYPKDAGKILVD